MRCAVRLHVWKSPSGARRAARQRRSESALSCRKVSAPAIGSRSDRIGALPFQGSPHTYVACGDEATLDQLLHLATLVETGAPIADDLAAAATRATSIGGARPKALLPDGDRDLVAEFSSTTDGRPVVQAETVAMLLAAHAGLAVPAVELVHASGKDVLLVERFERPRVPGPDKKPVRTRRQMVTIMTVLALWEMNSRYAQPRNTRTSSQAIDITRDGQRSSQLWLCRTVAPDFHLSPAQADATIDQVHAAIKDNWDSACEQARLTSVQRADLWGREFCNPFIFDATP